MGTGPLSCMASLSAQLAMWEGAGPEAGRAAWGPPGRRPQSAVSSGVSAQRGLSLGGRWRPRRHGPVPGVWEEGLEPERVSLRRAALLRPLLTSRVGLGVRVTGAVLPPGPGSGRPPGPLRRLSLPGPAPLASGPLFPRPQDPDIVLSDWIAFFSGPETAAQGPAVPSRGLPLRPCPGGRLLAAQLCPRRAWRHSAASAGHSDPKLLRTFRGQGWGARPWRAQHRPARRSAGLGKAGGDGLLRVLLFEEGARALGGGPGRGGRWGTLTPPEWPGQEACTRQGPFPISAGPRSSPRCVGEDRGPRGV